MERGEEVFVEFDDGFEVRADDALCVCGSVDCLEWFQREFGTTVVHAGRA